MIDTSPIGGGGDARGSKHPGVSSSVHTDVGNSLRNIERGGKYFTAPLILCGIPDGR